MPQADFCGVNTRSSDVVHFWPKKKLDKTTWSDGVSNYRLAYQIIVASTPPHPRHGAPLKWCPPSCLSGVPMSTRPHLFSIFSLHLIFTDFMRRWFLFLAIGMTRRRRPATKFTHEFTLTFEMVSCPPSSGEVATALRDLLHSSGKTNSSPVSSSHHRSRSWHLHRNGRGAVHKA